MPMAASLRRAAAASCLALGCFGGVSALEALSSKPVLPTVTDVDRVVLPEESPYSALKGVAIPEFSRMREDEAIFTHASGDLHCPDRGLRHPCVGELRAYLDDKNNTFARHEAYSCVQSVLQKSDDFWELKNMTHLLLDLDAVKHVFDKESRDDDFVMAGIQFAYKLMQHPECLAEFDRKCEMEARCVPLYGKIALLKLKNAGMVDDANALFERLTKLTWQGEVRSYGAGEAVAWDHFMHTPQTWVKGLRSLPIWERDTWHDLPICKQLEDNFGTIKEEVAKALKNETESGFDDAYRFLYEKGEWNQILLYGGREFKPACEKVFPKLCALLKTWLPSKPGLPWVSDQNEQVLVLKMKPGTDVEVHSGPANNILNIHIGISGLDGAQLVVANKTYGWEEGKVIAWDGSYDHSINCLKCKQDRVIMMVRYMHPDMSLEHFKGMPRTHFEEVPLEYQ
eukprot:TRINITY_DN34107_c0_g1_i1.p1 TRINITY_DN34107_c0_g1~~TRINITY_DN34107_c0_g1_i1.p1  ORF type:complete len:454 (+),score=122.54 TRINITY_DN34107_c0_g1_i1:112-1473(+)